MTCIVALVENGLPNFAGDALVVSTPSQYHSKVSQNVRREPKVFKNNGMLFGFNGAVRMGQLLRYVFEPPEYVSGQDKIRYLVAQFIPALQKCLKEGEFQEGTSLDGGILLALESELFVISEEFGSEVLQMPMRRSGKPLNLQLAHSIPLVS